MTNQRLEERMYDISDDPMFNEKLHDNLYANLEHDEIFEDRVVEILSRAMEEAIKSLYITRGCDWSKI